MRKLKLFLRTISVAICALLIISNPVLAVEDSQDEIIKKGITAYEKNPSCFGLGAVVGGATVPQSTLDAITALKSTYEQASQTTGIAWQIFAVLDYREGGNRPDASMLDGGPFGVPAVDHPELIPMNKLDSVIMGAGIFKDNAKSVYGVDVSKPMNDDQLKNAFLAYHRGFIYKNAGATYNISPYVMNFFDEAHQNMAHPLKSVVPGETLPGVVDANLGAFTLYTAIGGVSTGGSCTAVADGNILKFILLYAWEDHRNPRQPNAIEMKPAYAAAIAAAQARIAKGINDYVGYDGIDCGGFVTRVMRDSGADPTYNSLQGSVSSGQYPYIQQNLGTKFQDVTDLPREPGDIGIIHDLGHTILYVGSVPGFNGKIASASGGGPSKDGISNRAPAAGNDNLNDYWWYRVIKK